MQTQSTKQQEDDRVVVSNDGEQSRQVVVPADPIRALRGRGRGEGLLDKLLTARADERERHS